MYKGLIATHLVFVGETRRLRRTIFCRRSSKSPESPPRTANSSAPANICSTSQTDQLQPRTERQRRSDTAGDTIARSHNQTRKVRTRHRCNHGRHSWKRQKQLEHEIGAKTELYPSIALTTATSKLPQASFLRLLTSSSRHKSLHATM